MVMLSGMAMEQQMDASLIRGCRVTDQQDQRDQQDQEPSGIDKDQMDSKEAQQLLDALKDRELDAQRRRFRATTQTHGKDW